MFQPGDTVRVKDQWPEQTGPVHIRTPWYLRGTTGQVVRQLGAFPNPEDLAFARPAEKRPLYHVRFRKDAIWSDAPPDDAIHAPPHDELQVEIYEHWLEKA